MSATTSLLWSSEILYKKMVKQLLQRHWSITTLDVHPYPKYENISDRYGVLNNIGLVHLKEALEIQPLALSRVQSMLKGSVQVYAWLLTRKQFKNNRRFKTKSLCIAKQVACVKSLQSRTVFCARGGTQARPCIGDWGSPIHQNHHLVAIFGWYYLQFRWL